MSSTKTLTKRPDRPLRAVTVKSTAVFPLGDSCYCLQLGSELSRDTNSQILSMYHRIKHQADPPPGILDIVPAYSTLGVHFDPVRSNAADIKAWMLSLAEGSKGQAAERVQTGKSYTLEVVYDGPDLNRVAEHAGLSVADVVRRHSGGLYTVAMIGFMPHFPYLLGLDASLSCPRQDRPRSHVPRGAVAIGGQQTGIYPEVSPGGWNVIGQTDASVCQKMKPGDDVRFVEGPRA
jgi:inhibitor of KinA